MSEDKVVKKSKKLLLIIIPILVVVLVGIGVAIPFLLKSKPEAKVLDFYISESKNSIVYGEDVFSMPITVKFEDGTQTSITLGKTEISEDDKAKLTAVGSYKINAKYKNLSKELEIIIIPANFSAQEISRLDYKDRVAVFREEGVFFGVGSIPENSTILYSVNDSVEKTEKYSLTAPGTYIVHAYLSKENYNEYHFQFTIRVIDDIFKLEGFDKDGEIRSKTVLSSISTFNLEECITKSDDIDFEVYADKALTNKLNSSNLNLKSGDNIFYMILKVAGIQTTQVYTIKIYRNQIFEVSFYLKEELLDTIGFDEGNDFLQIPAFSKTGYYITGWKNKNVSITQPFVPTSNTRLDAVYEVLKYTISYELDGGVLGNKVENFTVETEDFTISEPTKKGYTFLGWTGTSIDGSVKEIPVLQGSTGNREYVATWKINQYTYSFYNGDELIKEETINYNSSIIAPNNPTKDSNSEEGENYHFKGWDKEVPSVISDKDLVFNAVYDVEKFSKNLSFSKGDNEVYIVDKGLTTETNIVVPETFNNSPVTAVADDAFSGMSSIKTITFNKNIKTIGKNAFANCSSLTEVNGLSDIEAIPEGTFENCVSLSNFEIGNGVVIVGERAFKNSSLKVVNIPASVVSIERYAFDECPINSYKVDENNANYASKDGNLYNKNLSKLLKYAVGKSDETFIIPGKVEEINEEAFVEAGYSTMASVLKLKNLVIPTSVKIIGANTIDESIVIYTYFNEEPELWDESIFSANTIYWNEGWDFVNGVPQNTLSVSEFKTGIYQNWMGYLKDDTRFFDIVMPGSHDAGTNGLGAWYKTQNSDFYNQLIGGVRYFDTRVAEYDGNVRCVHADSGDALSSANAKGVYFKDLLNDLMKFINENPSEIIVLDFQHIWNDFSSQVIPMIEENIPSKLMLKKSQTSDLSSLTIGQLRNWGVNIIMFVNDTVSYKPNFDEKEYLFERSNYLLSPYDGSSHQSGGDTLIGHFPSYFEQSDGTKLFVLQSQRTGNIGNLNIESLEVEFRNQANRYLRSLATSQNSATLAKLNVVMRDFSVDDIGMAGSAKETIQSILFLNFEKGNIKESRDYYFKVMLDYDAIKAKVEQENPSSENTVEEI